MKAPAVVCMFKYTTAPHAPDLEELGPDHRSHPQGWPCLLVALAPAAAAAPLWQAKRGSLSHYLPKPHSNHAMVAGMGRGRRGVAGASEMRREGEEEVGQPRPACRE